jgi:hypothetical protein
MRRSAAGGVDFFKIVLLAMTMLWLVSFLSESVKGEEGKILFNSLKLFAQTLTAAK